MKFTDKKIHFSLNRFLITNKEVLEKKDSQKNWEQNNYSFNVNLKKFINDFRNTNP